MLKQKLKKLLALALSLIMMSSLITPLLPTAQAAGSEPVALDDSGGDSGGSSGPTVDVGTGVNYYDPDDGRPNLYVDFLGDNVNYRPRPLNDNDPKPGVLNAPGAYDQSAVTNLDGNPANGWKGYTSSNWSADGTIFWVGVGVDRLQVLKLMEGQEGLSSLELGFYYNDRYIEPYVNGSGDFAATITAANINNGAYPENTQWNSLYSIRHAETDLPIADATDAARPFLPGVTDEVTREPMTEPSLEDIRTATLPEGSTLDRDNWRMTYISLELDTVKLLADTKNLVRRGETGDATWSDDNGKGTFLAYDETYFPKDEDGNPVKLEKAVPAAASGEEGPQYLLLIPFKLKQYDPNKRLCLRLIRDATHFSIGAGEDGTEPYAAWEKTTTRNPGHDIKLLTRFTGDLNIFTGEKIRNDTTYRATLRIINGGDSRNHAQLGITEDPSLVPITVDTDNAYISGLHEGTGMQTLLSVQSGYKATVTVYEVNDGGVLTVHVHQVVADQVDYRFVMPARSVEVWVRFEKDTDSDPTVFLSELPLAEGTTQLAPRVEGNDTTITYEDVDPDKGLVWNLVTNSWGDTQSHAGLHRSGSGIVHASETPAGEVPKDKTVVVEVNTHADYIAKVHIFNFADEKWVDQGLTVSGTGAKQATGGVVTLPYGGSVRFTMPDANVDVEVTYELAETHTAKLEVYHATGATVLDTNLAQLVYSSYDDDNVRSAAYSGRVYENDKVDPHDHSAVKTDNKPETHITWVPKSAAAMSNSLGGDPGYTGTRSWTETADLVAGARAIMSQLYSATDPSALAQGLKDINYSTLSIAGSVNGFRRNTQGELYGDNQLYYSTATDELGLANVLWELRERILKDPALTASYVKSVYTADTPPAEAYRYFELTPAQVQAYILELLQAQEQTRRNELKYRDLNNRYQKALQRWEAEKNKGYASAVPPEAPEWPRGIQLDSATGVRTYEGVGYRSVYANSYEQYMTAYEGYLDTLATATGFTDTPKSLANATNVVTVPILSDTDAATTVSSQNWQSRSGNGKAEISTRDGRTVWVALEADSQYIETSIGIYSATTGQLIQSLNVTSDTALTGFRNVYSFTMPSQDCVVRVTYRPRALIDLDFEINGADGKVDNVTSIEAYQANSGGTAPTLVERNNRTNLSLKSYKGSITSILDGSYISALVKTAEGYTVTVTALDESDGGSITVTPVAAPNPADGVIYRILASNSDPTRIKKIKLVVTYEPEEVELNTATIRGETYPGDSIDWRNTARWDTINGSNQKQNVAEGTVLNGVIQVAPGYYIHSVTATGASGTYTFTVDGNGYNNGWGTYASDGATAKVPVQLQTTMPDEDLLVTVTFRRGIPPVNPGTRLTLIVKDEDNTASPYANNWAKAFVLDDSSAPSTPVLGPVGLATGNGLTAYDYVEAGQVVEVEYHAVENLTNPNENYYVSSINVGPDSLGVEIIWQGKNGSGNDAIRFIMPPASAGVTVEFKKGKTPTYFLSAYRTENGKSLPVTKPDPTNPAATITNPNIITGVGSDTIRGFLPATGIYTPTNTVNPERIPDPLNSNGTGAAKANERVTVTFKAADTWYVQSVVVASSHSVWTLPIVTDPLDTRTDNVVRITSGKNDGHGETTFTAVFFMPSEDAEFVVNYRDLPIPVNPEHMVNLIVRDRDNVNDPATGSVVVDNWVRGSYTSATNSTITTPSAEADRTKLGAYYPSQMDVLYPQGGDTVNIEYQLQPGFIMDYIVVTPAGLPLRRIYPSYDAAATGAGGVVSGRATFTMPSEDVTVVASIIKSDEPHKYTANLILRPPAGVDVKDVGEGTFYQIDGVPYGSLDSYPDNAKFSLLTEPGKVIDLDLYAKDGYYIRVITVDPATGATATLSGSFGRQSGRFVMPAADVNVNVWFEKKWPDQVQYDLTLEVLDPSFTPDNYAAFRSADGRPLDNTPVVGNNSKTISYAAYDRDEVIVDIHPTTGFHVSRSSIKVTDSWGRTLDWRFVPGVDGGQAIAFTMPPMSTKVTVTFYRDGDPNEPDPPRSDYVATLHITGGDVDNTAALTDGTNTVTATGASLTGLRAGQTVTLKDVTHSADRLVSAAYAVSHSTGEQLMLPITLVTGGGSASFAMPEDNADVYVTFKTQTDPPDANDRVMRLVVAGPVGSGSATMSENDAAPANSISVDAHGSDFLWAEENKTLTVTLSPATGYYVSALTVTDSNGKALTYDWLSMVSDGVGGWKANNKQQFTLTVPSVGGTVYVRYEKLPDPDDPDTPRYTAQIVVNDEAYSSPQNIPSENDAYFSQYATVAAIQKRWREAVPGEWVDLSVVVHTGYRIEYIKVVPQKYGLTPGLALGPIESQSTGFIMPADNVTVYVKFIRDDLDRYNATLVVNGVYNANPTGPVNEAQISSPYSGTEGPIHAGQDPVSVQAAADRETVTVDYWWDAASSVASLTVTDATGASVPFNQINPHQISLPMVAKNITITITYRDDPDPVGYEVYLHVIDNSPDESIGDDVDITGDPIPVSAEAWAQL
ncbi:MAG: hypothetical protein NC311_13170, partial [Muribaculaceae bacterium]|nr:hypothetical protein [Muribaculaceae bacterium]